MTSRHFARVAMRPLSHYYGDSRELALTGFNCTPR